VDAARHQLEAAQPDLPPIDRLKPAEELVPTPEQAEALRHREYLTDHDTGQRLSALKVNWPSSKELDAEARIPGEVTVFIPAWLSDVEKGPTHLRVEQVALQSEEPLLAINPPSHGESDNLTPEQRQSLDAGEGFASMAHALLRSLKAEGVDHINLVGTSQGGAIASSLIALAHEYDIEVHEAILVDPANAENTETPAIRKRALRRGFKAELKELDLYHTHPQNPKMAEATWQGKWYKKLKEAAMALAPAGKGRGIDTYFRFPSGMATGALESDLEVGLQHQPNLHVSEVNGGVSPISTSEANNAIKDRLEKTYPGRVERIIRAGDTHSVLEDPAAYGDLVHKTLKLRRRAKKNAPVSPENQAQPGQTL
jgi:pimeloyl-ACP methyl ester carboxylesterase